VEKQYILHIVCIALVILHAMRMLHVVICGLSRSTIFFPHYLIKRTIFLKKVTEHKMCVLISLQCLYETFLILRRNERDMIKNVY